MKRLSVIAQGVNRFLEPRLPPLYIFDLDGTVCNVKHRVHFVEGEDKQFEKFNRACVNDVPNWPVYHTLKCHKRQGCDIWLFSGRDDYVQQETEEWLARYEVPYDWLNMRPANSSQIEDQDLKESWLLNMLDEDRERLVAVYDDRNSVVDMWRRNGVACFQVAPGDF